MWVCHPTDPTECDLCDGAKGGVGDVTILRYRPATKSEIEAAQKPCPVMVAATDNYGHDGDPSKTCCNGRGFTGPPDGGELLVLTAEIAP